MELSKQQPLGGFIGVLCLLGFILIFAYIRWEEVVERESDGSFSISREREAAIEERTKRLRRRTELYKLTASVNGYFYCPLCPPEATTKGKFFLYKGEVYKYGVTMYPNQRYSKGELARWQLEYTMIDFGNRTEMEIKETIFMGNYPVLPENLRRKKTRRIATPPGSGTKLR